MKIAVWLVVAASVLLAGAAEARPKAPVPPAAVLKAAQQLFIDAWPEPEAGDDPADYAPRPPAMPDAKTVRAWLKSGFLKPVRLSMAPSPEWLIDTTQALSLFPYYCGTGGCTVQIWMPMPGDRARKIFDQQVNSYHFRWLKRGRTTWMDADFHGSYCGEPGNAPCPWGYEWRGDGRARYGLFATWRFAHGEVVHPGPPPQAVDPLADPASPADAGVPEPILTLLTHQTNACAGWQGTYDTDRRVNRLPDLNGDGIDDWSFDGASSYCTFDTNDNDSSGETRAPHGDDDACTILVCENRIYLSRRDGVEVMWDQAPLDPAHDYALRYRQGQVELLQLNDPPQYPGTCDTYSIDNCDLQPISLSPKA